MASLMSPPFLDVGAGLTPADGSKLYFYVVGSATPKDTYTTAAATTAHTNPVIADSKGVFPAIYITGDLEWVLQDKNSVQRNTGTVSEFVTSTELAADLNLAYTKTFATLAAAVSDVNLVDGDVLITGDRDGSTWDVVLSSTVTENTYNVVQCTGVATLSLVLRVAVDVVAAAFGASTSASASSNVAAIQAAIDSVDAAQYITLSLEPSAVYDINAAITSNNRRLTIKGNGARFNLTANSDYILKCISEHCVIDNLVISKETGVTGDGVLFTGSKHRVDGLRASGDLFPKVLHLVGLRDSFFTNLRITNDSTGTAAASRVGTIMYSDYSVNNTVSDSYIGICENAFEFSTTTDPSNGNKSEGFTITNVITVYCVRAVQVLSGTSIGVYNCVLDFNETAGVSVTNGFGCYVSGCWIAMNSGSTGSCIAGNTTGFSNLSATNCHLVGNGGAGSITAKAIGSSSTYSSFTNNYLQNLNFGTMNDATSYACLNRQLNGTANLGNAKTLDFTNGKLTTNSITASNGDLFVADNANLVIGASAPFIAGQTSTLQIVSATDGTTVRLNRVGTDGGSVVFYKGGVSVGSISVTGSATAYNTSSDYRLKNNPIQLEGSAEFIASLHPKSYTWECDGTSGVGFIAHELQAVSPSSVSGEKDAIDQEGNIEPQSVAYASPELIAHMVAELQALREELNILKGI